MIYSNGVKWDEVGGDGGKRYPTHNRQDKNFL